MAPRDKGSLVEAEVEVAIEGIEAALLLQVRNTGSEGVRVQAGYKTRIEQNASGGHLPYLSDGSAICKLLTGPRLASFESSRE